MSFRNVIKVTFFVYKKEGTSHEEFAKYWSGTHAPLAVEVMKKHKIISFSHQHTLPGPAARISELTGGHLPTMDCDGIAQLVFPDWETVDGFFGGKEDDELRSDSGGFMDPTKTRIAVGDEIQFIQDGKVL